MADERRNRLIETIAQIGAVTASVSLAASFTYDWGFFSALGIGFGESPTSLSDHLSSWLVWIPVIVPGIFLWIMLELVTRRIDYKEDPTYTYRLFWKNHKKDPLWHLSTWLFVTVLAAWVLLGLGNHPWLPAGVSWILLIWTLAKQKPTSNFRHTIQSVLSQRKLTSYVASRTGCWFEGLLMVPMPP